MAFIDWIVVCVPLLIVVVVGFRAQQYVKSVADFMAANRSAGRYLLCISGGELQAGAVVFVAAFEVFHNSGFAYAWWGGMGLLLGYFLRATGFVTYRYRETRAMTLGQFFEIRYNKSFRLFTGLLGFLAGLLNFGIIPSIGARVLVHFLGMPEKVHILSMTLPTYIPLMALFLSITAFVALSGGVITVMVINTLEGIMSQVFYLIIIAALLCIFSWAQMKGFLVNHAPGESMVNPFDSYKVQNFNIWTQLMMLFLGVYTIMAWQNASAYNSAGLTAHEGRMANILSSWREMGKAAVVTLLALCAITYMDNPAFTAGAAHVRAAVAAISDPQAREQMELPIALATLLPIGVKGVFCAVLLMGIFGGDATHLHSWGGIFVQDFLVPLRRKPFGPRAHLIVLRCAIAGVALFAFLFGALFHLKDFISMWWSVTQGVFTGGAGAAIIGGLYWKKGNATGAWSAFVAGSILSVGGIVLQQIYGGEGGHFQLNGVEISFFSSLIAIAVYVAVSLATHKENFNLNRMLHRGEYSAIKSVVGDNAQVAHHRVHWGKLMGIDENFTRGDKFIAGTLFSWSVFWVTIFIVGTVWNLVAPWSNDVWVEYYHVVGISLPIFFAVVTGIWFTWGGVRDMLALFRRLSRERINTLDDGTVVNNQNLDEAIVSGRSQGMPSNRPGN